MQIEYCCPFWGSKNDTPDEFIDKVVADGYNGIEINLPQEKSFIDGLFKRMAYEKENSTRLFFILQHLTQPDDYSVASYIEKMQLNLRNLASYSPGFINSQTGKDYYTFDENCRVIEAVLNVSVKTGIRVIHETHRGRFSFHAATLVPYLEKFPEMELAADFSHFCTVSESMLQDQAAILDKIIPHVSHIHARIGFEQGPQVNDPNAPEWAEHLNTFVEWWKKIIETKVKKGWKKFTITPEFGPPPYMPVLPNSKLPLSNQWHNNKTMMDILKKVMPDHIQKVSAQ